MLALVAQTDKETLDNLDLAFKICLPEYRLKIAHTEKDCLEMVKTEHPDIVILDSSHAENDGAELMNKVRACSRVPIICLSAVNDEYKAVKALEGGADRYITKPFRQLEFMAYVRALLRNTGQKYTKTGI
jgi:DNA-binding response OmpR family regulator